ncbi:MAG: hypothetical protein KAQ94_06945 [Arcobacteraceae bacterium]|nr:hypothetical protein [Arcobacteraceae bacterium]
MSKYYCVKLVKDTYSCVVLKNNFAHLSYLETLIFSTFDELSVFLKSQNNVSLSLFQPDFIETSIEIQSSITSHDVISDLIKTKLTNDQIDTSNVYFSFNKIKETKKLDKAKYKIYGIYKNNDLYKKSLNLLSNKNCGNLSLEVFALYDIAKKIHTDKNFLSIYISNYSLTIVAGNTNNILFLRSKYLTFTENTEDITSKERNRQFIEEVVKNTLYIKEKMRDVKFDILTINGALYDNSEVFENISQQIEIKVSSLKPNNKDFKEFTPEKFNQYLIEIGTLRLESRFNFTPNSLKAKKEFNSVLNFYIPFLIVLIGFFSYNSYSNYQQYSHTKIQYDNLSNKILQTLPNLGIDKNNISNLNLFVASIKSSDEFNVLNYITSIKKSIDKINSYDFDLKLKLDFKNFIWTNSGAGITIYESNNFKELLEFNIFINKLKRVENELGKEVIITVKSDPKSLIVKSTFTFEWNKK